jgi:hypothetical protein
MVITFMVRIYYLKMRFVKGFTLLLRAHFSAGDTQRRRSFMSDSSIDDEK